MPNGTPSAGSASERRRRDADRCCAHARATRRSVATRPRRKSRPRFVGATLEFERAHAAVAAVLLDLPAIADGNGDVVAPRVAATRRSACARASRCRRRDRACTCSTRFTPASRCEARSARLAHRPQRIGGDVVAHHRPVMRMPRERAVAGCARRARALRPANERPPVWTTKASSASTLRQPGVARRAGRNRSPRHSRRRTPGRTCRCHRSPRGGRTCRSRRRSAVRGMSARRQLRAHARIRSGIVAVMPSVVLAEARKRADLRVVGKRRNRRDARVGCGAAQQRVEPAARDDRVRIEQHDVGARPLHAAVRRRREAEIALVAQELDARIARVARSHRKASRCRDRATRRRSAAA